MEALNVVVFVIGGVCCGAIAEVASEPSVTEPGESGWPKPGLAPPGMGAGAALVGGAAEEDCSGEKTSSSIVPVILCCMLSGLSGGGGAAGLKFSRSMRIVSIWIELSGIIRS